MVERLLVYKQTCAWPVEYEIKIVDFDREKKSSVEVKYFKFAYKSEKKNSIQTKERFADIAKSEGCDKIVNDNIFRINYLIEPCHKRCKLGNKKER